jgi:myosin-5
VDDAMEFRTTQQALSTVGISVEKQWAVFKLLAALLHLGNVKIAGVRSDSNIDDTDAALQLSTRFLGVPLADFKKWTIKKQITTRSEKITTSLSAAQASVVRDSVSKFIYACLFEWLVDIVNESLAGEGGEAANRAETFIGILDIYGFEHFKKVSVSDCAQKSCWSHTRHTPLRIHSSSSASTTPTKSCNKSSTLMCSS